MRYTLRVQLPLPSWNLSFGEKKLNCYQMQHRNAAILVHDNSKFASSQFTIVRSEEECDHSPRAAGPTTQV